MAQLDLTQPDRDLGMMLSGEEVEALRETINVNRTYRGFRLKEVAAACDVPEHSVRNFANRKSIRPDNAVLGRLYKYVARNRELFPDRGLATNRGLTTSPHYEAYGRLLDDLIKKRVLRISEGDLKRVFTRYCGHYLCFRRSARASRLAVSWLHIIPLNRNYDLSKGGFPLPRFTLFIKYPDRFEPQKTRSHITMGYALTRHGHLFLTGYHDAEPQSLILKEPEISKFTYLQGLCLLTSGQDRQPFAARIVCQYLGPEVSRLDWKDKIGAFVLEDFERLFDNAEIVTHALGGNEVVFGSDPE